MADKDEGKAETESSDKKEELKKIVKETVDGADRITNLGEELATNFGPVSDLGNIVEPLVDDLDSSDIDAHTEYWDYLRNVTVTVAADVEAAIQPGIISTASGSTSAYSSNLVGTIANIDTSGRPPIVVAAVTQFHEFIENPDRANEVRDLLTTLGLDVPRPDRVSPLEQFDVAFSAYERNAPAVESLIPMRSSIAESIYILLDQRPSHSRVPSWDDKVRSIFSHLAYDTVLPATVDILADEVRDILDDLSAAKDADLGRDEIRDQIYQAINFYHSLLKAIDKSKLRVQPTT